MLKRPECRPQGAARHTDGSVHWRVWAPTAGNVSLVTIPAEGRKETAMSPEGDGYFVHRQPQAVEGLRYALKLPDGQEYPDPASRWQPDGVHRPSAVFFPESYSWSDASWRGVARKNLAIYELHVGAFTPQGTFQAIAARLEQLASLGVTAIEIMPLAQFPGNRNWGYDGVHPYAVQNSYGGPREFQRCVDAAHQNGLAVFLDVVYNHVGPEGNYFAKFGPYFTDSHHTPWGKAINYDGPDCDPVRQFVIDNACSWIRDFHVDGLRLDAVQTIFDFSARHILADIQSAVQEVARSQDRIVHVIAETNQNDMRLVNLPELGGYGLDGVWSDDFHHSVHALLTGQRDGYYQDFGRAEHLLKAINKVFVYDGCYSPFHRRCHGSRAGDADRTKFVICVQNHDQIGNRRAGDRLSQSLSLDQLKLAAGTVLLSPFVPLLFMGEEYGEKAPFQYFVSHGDSALIEAVRRGRKEEFAKFGWTGKVPDPQDESTFLGSQLNWDLQNEGEHRVLWNFYRELLRLRRELPALARLDKQALEITSFTDKRVMLVRRWNAANQVLIAFHFDGATTELALPIPSGRWRKILDSTEKPSAVDGNHAPEIFESRGELRLSLHPWELILFEQQSGSVK
jgi:maltooligosyltrehalose trehalohydrolase